MKSNEPNNQESIDSIPQEVIAEMNSYITSDDPNVFMPHIARIDRKVAMLILELTARGKLSPSYESYSWVLLIGMTGSPEAASLLFKKGYNFLRNQMEDNK